MADEIKKFKMREEKHVTAEVTCMSWSSSMDLLAIANANAEVIINRLSWQRVWSRPPPSDGDLVGSLSWRPDGKVIAVGYKSGTVRICDVEKGDFVHIANVQGGVTSLNWLEPPASECKKDAIYSLDNSSDYLPSANEHTYVCDDGSLPEDRSSGLEAYESFRELTAQKNLNLLLVGTDKGQVHILSYGAFPTGIIDVDLEGLAPNAVVDSAIVSYDLSRLSVVLKAVNGRETKYWIKSFETSLLLSRCVEIRLLASKYVMIASAQMELQVIIEQMCEAWEEILREMDSQLLKFAKEKQKLGQQSTVSNDFLELLLFGTTSPELQAFLLHELTDKGVKKLKFSVENSYTNIQKLVVRQLLRVSQNVTSHLSDLHGMSQWYDKFGVLGLNPDVVHAAVKTAGAFAISACELQQVIETSIKNFKAFFRWLYIAIMRLSNLPHPADITKMTQHDIKFVGDFLHDNFIDLLDEEEECEKDKSHFMDQSNSSAMDISMATTPDARQKQTSTLPVTPSNVNGNGNNGTAAKQHHQGFKLEKVGQYLKRENLIQPPNYSANPWTQFLRSSNLNSSKVLYPDMHGKSMLQRKELLDESISNAVLEPARVIGASMNNTTTFHLLTAVESKDEGPANAKVCQFMDNSSTYLWTVFVMDYLPCTTMCMMRQKLSDFHTLEVIKVQIGRIGDPFSDDSSLWPTTYVCESHLLLDFAVYNSDTLTLLLREDGEDEMTVLMQLPLSVIPVDKMTTTTAHDFSPDMDMHSVDLGPFLPRGSATFQSGVTGHCIAVSGARTTASMLLTSKRRIRLFLLEEGDGDDEDDDDEDEDETGLSNASAMKTDNDTTTGSGRTGGNLDKRDENDDDKENVMEG